ncbi:MAG TPA: SHOCT domain-containing protein [Candidatus Alistipes stercorigallinarum]|nr:SHOCT domain-containing protein [Candidatus Alistipes stercorigallinarum]
MTRYRIEEDDETPDFIVFIEILLCIIFLPIGIIILIVKIVNYFSDRAKQNALHKSQMSFNKAEELRTLASLRDSGIISQAEFQQRKNKIMKNF